MIDYGYILSLYLRMYIENEENINNARYPISVELLETQNSATKANVIYIPREIMRDDRYGRMTLDFLCDEYDNYTLDVINRAFYALSGGSGMLVEIDSVLYRISAFLSGPRSELFDEGNHFKRMYSYDIKIRINIIKEA